MKKFFNYFLRIVLVAASFLSLVLLLNSPVQVVVNNPPAFAKELIHKLVKENGNETALAAAEVMSATGTEDKILSELPPKLCLQFSYWNIYQLAQTYTQKGSLTSSDLNLDSSNEVANAAGRMVTRQINHELSTNSETVKNGAAIYKFAIWTIILLYLLAALLFIFGRSTASLALLLGNIISFGGLALISSQLQQALRTGLYQGIDVNLSMLAWLGLSIGMISAIVWPFFKRSFNRK